MIPNNRKWRSGLPASSQTITELQAASKATLPREYYDLLIFSNGGEGPLSIEPRWFVLDSAEEAIANQESRAFEEFFPGFFVFGGNGAGEIIAFDLRGTKPWPVVMIDSANINLDESVIRIADNFSAFIEAIGIRSA